MKNALSIAIQNFDGQKERFSISDFYFDYNTMNKPSTAVLVLGGLFFGTIFGIAFEKGKVYHPIIIQKQMLFTNFTMLKMFLAAMVTGMIGIHFLEKTSLANRVPKPLVRDFLNFHKYGSNILGGALLGIGMTITGACPGTVAAQIGAGVHGAVYVALGGLIAAFLYGWISHKIVGSKEECSTMDKKLGVNQFMMVGVAVAALVAIIFIAEKLSPHLEEMAVAMNIQGENGFGLMAKKWSPIVSGVIVGLLQIPSLIFTKSPLGTSSSYVAATGGVAKAIKSDLEVKAPYFAKYTRGASNTWQMAAMVGIVFGAYLSKTLSGVEINTTAVGSPLRLILGGMVLLFGSRMAGGCTSGHGLSGCSQFAESSLVTTAAMFGGGILSANLLYLFGLL